MVHPSSRSVTVAAVASVVLVASACSALAVTAVEASSGDDHVLERSTDDVTDAATPVQADSDRHQETAVIGIAVLFALGGMLVARNRLQDRTRVNRGDSRPKTEEFLTDREKVRRLVEENGGRMKQAEIVDSVEWSKAKVSRLLADLESDEEIIKLRLGRENLICLDGYEPPASQPTKNPGRK